MDGVIAGRRTIGVQSDQEGCEAALVRARPAVVLRTWHNRQLGIGNCSKSLFLAFLREIWGLLDVYREKKRWYFVQDFVSEAIKVRLKTNLNRGL